VIVLGATDVGKSTFIRASLVAVANDTRLIDLDPGQKMLGAPGTASLGWLDGRGGERLDRFVFLGSTSATMFSAIASAAAALAERSGPFIVNTSGFVQGLGARLQAMTMASIAPDPKIEPAPPSPFLSDARPVCALADEAGADMEIGILEGSDEEGLFIRARAPARPPRLVRLGRMWAAPGNGWKLLETLSPSWIA
jgi:hypothetical protein